MCSVILPTYEIVEIDGLQQDHTRRKVLFLTSRGDKRVIAKSVFDRLNDSSTRSFMTRFDAWISGQPPKANRYHGWDASAYNGKYQRCFVFKSNPHRLYGFLCHPKKSDLRYEACILATHAEKRQHETDETELKHIEEIRNTIYVWKAIEKLWG